jgi:hypothetical protein
MVLAVDVGTVTVVSEMTSCCVVVAVDSWEEPDCCCCWEETCCCCCCWASPETLLLLTLLLLTVPWAIGRSTAGDRVMVKSWLVRLEVGGCEEELVVEEEVLVVLVLDEPESEPEPETETPELEPSEVVFETWLDEPVEVVF